MECMFCKRTGERTFNLYSQYGNAPNTIRDDMVELFGLEIESFLNDHDHVCNVCMNMLDNITKMRRHMMNIIMSPREYKYTMKFGRFWDAFASYKFDECDFDTELVTPSRTPTPIPRSRTSTPSNFVICKHSREYDSVLEEAVAKREWYRSQSRSSARSFEKSDEEVENYCENTERHERKKLRGHNWSGRRSRRRRQQTSSVGPYQRIPKLRQLRSVQSEGLRSFSPVSDCSYVSYIRPKKDWSRKTPTLKYDSNGELLLPRTRSVNQLEKLEKEKKEIEQCKKYKCTDDDDCMVYMENLDLFTQHRISEHRKLALYPCLECSLTYTTDTHLKIHEKNHDSTPRLCLMCGSLMDSFVNLQKHQDAHLQYSVPCSYCDFSFLSKRILEEHVQTSHPGKKRRIYRRPRRCILERIDSVENFESAQTDSSSETREYEGRIYVLALKKHYTVSSTKDRPADEETEVVNDASEKLSEVRDLADQECNEDECEGRSNDDSQENNWHHSDYDENNIHTEIMLDESSNDIS